MNTIDPFVDKDVRKIGEKQYFALLNLKEFFLEGKRLDEDLLEEGRKAIKEAIDVVLKRDIPVHYGFSKNFLGTINSALLINKEIALQDLGFTTAYEILSDPAYGSKLKDVIENSNAISRKIINQRLLSEVPGLYFLFSIATNDEIMKRIREGMVIYIPHFETIKRFKKPMVDAESIFNINYVTTGLYGALSNELEDEAYTKPIFNAMKATLLYGFHVFTDDDWASRKIRETITNFRYVIEKERGKNITVNSLGVLYSKIMLKSKNTNLVKAVKSVLQEKVRLDPSAVTLEKLIEMRERIELDKFRGVLSKLHINNDSEFINDIQEHIEFEAANIKLATDLVQFTSLLGLNFSSVFYAISPSLALIINLLVTVAGNLNVITNLVEDVYCRLKKFFDKSKSQDLTTILDRYIVKKLVMEQPKMEKIPNAVYKRFKAVLEFISSLKE